ncbi:Transmembrane protein 106C [Acipenser ruthenus]|uniref:Transmembrane protein 106C n=1 Tax=Acipenser ruthenus TaxID=7906 RepID=A0A662YMH8_ACIRT|nr:Transmembrane protein 106C [Acipenser ruthenus]
MLRAWEERRGEERRGEVRGGVSGEESTLNISNPNFYTVSVDSLTSQVLYMKTVIGTQQLSNVLQIQPLSQRQVNFTVAMEISGSLSYV